MKKNSLAALVAIIMFVLSACSSEPIPISAPADSESATQSRNAQALVPTISVASSEFGDILVNVSGLSLYGFTDDLDGTSTCSGGCANAWPPLLVEGANLPADLDATIFSVVQRADGTHQLKAGPWPLYLFAGDTAPGQTTGHLSGDVWFLATPAGKLIGVEPAPVDEVESAAAVSAQPQDLPFASVASSSLGDVLVSGAGLTLYGFTNDVDGLPTCKGGCAEAWPPILVADGQLPAGLDEKVFSVVARPDGASQLKAGKWPLYLFAGDTAPGQTTGHLSGDAWFAVSPSGALIDGPAPAPASEVAEVAPAVPVVATASSSLGEILVDADGLSLYGFLKDGDGLPTCEGGCADAWPPLLVESPDLPANLDDAVFSVVARSDGANQLKAGKWPLYRFAGDTAAGQTTGQLSGDVWFLAAPNGKLIGVPVPAAPPAATAAPTQPAPTAAAAVPAPTAVPPATPTPIPAVPTPTPAAYGYPSDS